MTLRSILTLIVLAAVPLAAKIATAQSDDFVLVDNIEPAPSNGADAGSSDGGAGADSGSSLEIVGISDALPVVAAAPGPDPRAVLENAVTRHARYCVSRSVEPADADIGFMYLLREGQPSATLTTVTNDEPIHASRLHFEVLRKIGDTRPVDIELPQKMFRECIQVAPLPIRPNTTERLSFRIKAGALILVVHDVSWTPL